MPGDGGGRLKYKPGKLFAGVVALWLLALVALYFALPGWQERGQFGDLFGSVNALFSGLAFAGLYSALRVQQEQLDLQRTELGLQREELKLQREEMAASRGELANQVKAQRAMFRATIAQVTVASMQARMEYLKMESEQMVPHARQQWWNQIRVISESLGELSSKIEADAAKEFDESAK